MERPWKWNASKRKAISETIYEKWKIPEKNDTYEEEAMNETSFGKEKTP